MYICGVTFNLNLKYGQFILRTNNRKRSRPISPRPTSNKIIIYQLSYNNIMRPIDCKFIQGHCTTA